MVKHHRCTPGGQGGRAVRTLAARTPPGGWRHTNGWTYPRRRVQRDCASVPSGQGRSPEEMWGTVMALRVAVCVTCLGLRVQGFAVQGLGFWVWG